MGLDLVEMAFRLERRFNITIRGEALRPAMTADQRGRLDMTAGELLAFVAVPPREIRCCSECQYSLRGHADIGRCPECGRPFDYTSADGAWEDVRQILSEVSGKKPDDIRRNSWLIRDLGFG